jgi:hypothetical protein
LNSSVRSELPVFVARRAYLACISNPAFFTEKFLSLPLQDSCP